MKQIVVDIDSVGAVQIRTKGYEGTTCIEETKFLKDLLGKEIAVQLTATFFTTSEENEKTYLPICG